MTAQSTPLLAIVSARVACMPGCANSGAPAGTSWTGTGVNSGPGECDKSKSIIGGGKPAAPLPQFVQGLP